METEEAAARRLLSESLHRLMFRSKSIRRQSELAAAVGVTQATISRVMAGSQNVTLELLAKIAEAFGVQPGALLLDADSSDMLTLFLRLDPSAKEVVSGELRRVELSSRPAVRISFYEESPPESEAQRLRRTITGGGNWGPERRRVEAEEFRKRLSSLSRNMVKEG